MNGNYRYQEYYQSDCMQNNDNDLSFNSQQQGQEQTSTSQSLEPDSSISSTHPQ